MSENTEKTGDAATTVAAAAVEPSPPPPPAAAKKAAKAKTPKAPKASGDLVHIVWVAPGYDAHPIGGLLCASPEHAESLRAVGKARPANDEEIKAAKGRDIPVYG